MLDKAPAWEKYIDKVLILESIVGELTDDMQISVVKEFVKNIKSKENRFYGSKKLETLHAAICEENWLETSEVNIRNYLQRSQIARDRLAAALAQASAMGLSEKGKFPQGNGNGRKQNGKKAFKSGDKKLYKPSEDREQKTKVICGGCGMRNHTKTECELKPHPDWNNSSQTWHESVKGKAWIKAGAKHLYFDKKLKIGAEGYESWSPTFSKPKTTKSESLYEDTDDSIMEETEDYFSAIGVTTDHTTPFTIPHTQNETVFKSVLLQTQNNKK